MKKTQQQMQAAMPEAATKDKPKTGAPVQQPAQAHPLPAMSGSHPVPSKRQERLMADAGKGVSRDRDDKLVPMIKVLQAQSPQCMRAKPEFIAGAEAGDFFLRGAVEPLVKGDKGFDFIPCAFLKCWLEFDGPRDEQPNFVARHRDVNKRPEGVSGLELDEDGYDYIDKKNGHRYTLSREHYGLVDRRPYVFPFGGSAHTTSREWQTFMDQFLLPNRQPEPSFNRKYQMTTTPKSNKSGDWYGIVYRHLGEVSDEEYELASMLFDAVMSGDKVAEAPEAPDGGATKDTAGI